MPELNCPKCDAPIAYEEADGGKAIKCTNCGADVLAIEAAEKLISLKCAGCGGAIDLRPGMTEAVCQYCGASYLLPPSVAPATKADVPEYLVPFKIFQSNMLEHLNEWLDSGVFTASDADKAATVVKVTAKYVPYYICNCEANSSWSGQNSTTHYRTVTKTRVDSQGRRQSYQAQEPYKQWHHASGSHAGHYRVAIVASPAISQEDADSLIGDVGNFTGDEGALPFGQSAREDNYPVEQATFDSQEARRRAKMKIEVLERSACESQVERLDSCSTSLSDLTARLSYHPIWWVTYNYKAKPYNCIMDGSTGAVTGKKPISKTKVVIAIVLAVIVLIIIIIIICVVGGGYFATSSSLINNVLEGAKVLV
jgi:DNA-directed RNA polymerase subunit RPC12/RpoP/ABC-type cobalt transport system substrate-binding protein